MALTVGDAVTYVREMTRHPAADQRLTNDQVKRFLNDHYRALRAELQDIAPTLHQQENFFSLSAGDSTFDLVNLANYQRLFSVEWYDATTESYLPVFRASGGAPFLKSFGGSTISLRHNVLHFSPKLTESLTFRVRYWSFPLDLTIDGESYVLPAVLELPLKMRAIAMVHLKDHTDFTSYKAWMDAAGEEVKRVTPALKNQFGAHAELGGVIEVKGY